MFFSATRKLWLATCAAVVALSSLLPAAEGARIETPQISCYSCFLIADDGRVLFARRAQQRLPNASTTKMVTALLVTRSTSPEETVLVSANAAATGGGGQDLAAGERYSVEALLYALLLTSSNDAAVALAEHVANSQSAFVEDMNTYVRRTLDLRDTHFVTAHGLDQPEHYSSAADLATIAEELLDVPELATVVATASTNIPGPRGSIPIENRNLLLEDYPGAIGVKTGFTADAGNVLVSAATRRGRTLIGVAMRSEDAAADSRSLLDYGWAKLSRQVLLRAGAPVGALLVAGGSLPVVARKTVRGSTDPTRVTLHFEPALDPGNEIQKGSVVGSIVLSAGVHPFAKVAAIAAGPAPPDDHGVAERVLTAVLGAFGGLIEAAGIQD